MEGVLSEEQLTAEDLLALDALVADAEMQSQGLSLTGPACSTGALRGRGRQPERASVNGATARRPDHAAPVVDLEDVGLVKDRRPARRRGLYVTDISSSEWCQQKVAFSLSSKVKEHTPAMVAGREKHAELEAETALESVEVRAASREDRFAIYMLNTLQGLRQLLCEGLTRELSICGVLQGCWVRGVVDQLELDDDGVCIVEHKTRFQPSLPSMCQKRTTALQLMLYRRLLSQLQHTFAPSNTASTFEAWELAPDRELSADIQAHAIACGAAAADLAGVAARLHDTSCALPSCSEVMRVNYIWQGDGQLLEAEEVRYNEDALEAALARHLGFWTGATPPEKVPAHEAWKCNTCTFRGKCWPGRVRQVAWQH